MSNLDQDAQSWLERLFEDEYCGECHGDAPHHTAIPLMGNWFARCDTIHNAKCQIETCDRRLYESA